MPHAIVRELVGLEPLKTWSLIVTLLGDLEGETLTGAEVRALLEPIGIKPEAIRVAFHRLKSDGWVVSRKSGREAVYGLTAMALRETRLVRADIYDRHPKYPDGWRIHVTRGGAVPDDGVQIAKDVALVPVRPGQGKTDALILKFDGKAVPAWVEEALVPAHLLQTARALTRLHAAAEAGPAQLSTEDRASLRILTLHHWRRVALRPGSWAHMFLLPDGTIAQCRGTVTAYLGKSDNASTFLKLSAGA